MGDLDSIPGLGTSPGEGNGNQLQYCLENPMDGGAWQAAVHEVAKSWAQLSSKHLLTYLGQNYLTVEVNFIVMLFIQIIYLKS